jgi:hypothetical protein
MYALYRRLLPSNQEPDVKLHRVFWGVQKQVPSVVLCETILWSTGEFILVNCPLENAKKLDPASPVIYF